MENNLSAGERIRSLRGSQAQGAFARNCSISQSYLSQIEKGKRGPSVEAVKAIAKYCGVSTDFILTGERPMRSEGMDAGYVAESEQKYGEEQKLKQNLASPELAGVGGMINTQLLEGIGMYILGDLVHDIMRDGSDDQRARLKRAGRAFLRTALAIAEEMDSASADQEKKQSQTGA